jgi:hypothetical protein
MSGQAWAAPSVLLMYGNRMKNARDKIPPTVHCSLTHLVQKDGKYFAEPLHFALYLETLETQNAGHPLRIGTSNKTEVLALLVGASETSPRLEAITGTFLTD